MSDLSIEMDKLSYEIFSVLESKFLFGYDDAKFSPSPATRTPPMMTPTTPRRPSNGRIRILSIDGGFGPSDGLLAGSALASLESSLQLRSGDPAARIADFFDVAAGSGAGGVLAAMLFTRRSDGRPLFSAEEALRILAKHRRGLTSGQRKGIFRGIFRRHRGGRLRRIFGEATLRDVVKPLLIPCFDAVTASPFLFSRADAVETDGYDFRIREVCAATCAAAGVGAVEMRSSDGRSRIVAVGGGVAMGNPTAAAITHVLNNKHEFPFAAGVEDLLVLSLGGDHCWKPSSLPSEAELARIAAEGAADMVDQAVAMAFGYTRTSNYVRIQAGEFGRGESRTPRSTPAAELLAERNVEAVMFRGKRLSEQTNGEKLELFSGELIKEEERRKRSPIPTVVIKQAMTPRTSSSTATTTTTAITSSSTSSSSP